MVLCYPLGQATDTDDTNFTHNIKEEAAHGVATQHVSQGSVAVGARVAECGTGGTAPVLDGVLTPSETSLSPSAFVPLEQSPDS